MASVSGCHYKLCSETYMFKNEILALHWRIDCLDEVAHSYLWSIIMYIIQFKLIVSIISMTSMSVFSLFIFIYAFNLLCIDSYRCIFKSIINWLLKLPFSIQEPYYLWVDFNRFSLQNTTHAPVRFLLNDFYRKYQTSLIRPRKSCAIKIGMSPHTHWFSLASRLR